MGGSIPYGYRPIKLYTGPKTFQMPVYVAGYGMNSMTSKKNFTALRWAQQALVGYNRPTNHQNIGFELFSYTGNSSCFGDSGGPNVVNDNGELKLLGITAFTTNACQGSMWIVDALSLVSRVRTEASRLRRTRMTNN